ncbi:MAG: hypothetical protein MI785_05130 [Kiloniellales bacterium]|nr:hypothetical protein [Kiloniellales bacterium]
MFRICAKSLLVLAVTLGSATAQDAKPPTVDALMSRLGYSEEDRAALKSGKIVTTNVRRTRDDQLIAAAAVYLPVPPKQILPRAREGKAFEDDPGILAFGALSPGVDPAEWQRVGFDPSERDEAEKLHGFRSGSDFNLSAREIEALTAKLDGVSGGDEDLPQKVSAAYREVLMARHQAYLQDGLSGISSYRHDDKVLEPAKELEAVAGQAEDFLRTYFPQFAEVFYGFPKVSHPGVSQDFFWLKRKVEGRPGLVLLHQMVAGNEDYVMVTRREYFVGHTYESLQVVAVALPVADGSAVFYVNSAFTDQITGFFSGVAQSVGQDRMRGDLTKFFEAVQQGTE